jgi:O-6-methylguanine DNA methyltransferase
MKNLKGTDFQKIVWNEIKKIPKGKTVTYKELAIKIGKPKAYRAVANACAKNPLLEIIPCHRVIRSDGKMGGYMGEEGIERKKRLLESEGVKLNFNSIK